MNRSRFFALLCASAFLAAPFTAAAAEAEISKVNYHHLTEDTADQKAEDPMVSFERRSLLYGAVQLADQRARYGSYYTVFWKVADRRGGPVTIRFEYRQEKTAAQVKTRELEVLDIKRSNTARFAVIGDEFTNSGKVVAWRASVVRDDRVLATYESFLWD